MEQVPNLRKPVWDCLNPCYTGKSDAVCSWFGLQGLAVSTIEVYLAGLRHFRIQAKLTCMAPLLHSLYINLIIKGIKRINSAKQPTQVQLPITATLMGRIKGSLYLEYVNSGTQPYISLQIKASKTDQSWVLKCKQNDAYNNMVPYAVPWKWEENSIFVAFNTDVPSTMQPSSADVYILESSNYCFCETSVK